ncbi:MAG: hemolysin family protein [Dysgonamonadaceae bacterium]|jgi:putative hemolysin|nr:hemolysin family protein [Dysgonamonadaceae bacterium]
MVDIVIILVLIVLNGFFALSEIAVVSSKKTKLEAERKKGSKGAEMALKLQSDPDNFLSSVQVGITLIGIVNGAYGGATLTSAVEPLFRHFAPTADYSGTIAMVLVVVLITYVSIVIGELVPKTLALNNSEKLSMLVSRPIHFISIVFYPFVKLLSVSTSLVNGIIGIKPKDEVISEMELRAMLKIASKEGVIETDENIIHEQVFYFSDKRAKHLMTHRTDIEWVDISKGRDEVIAELMKVNHSRVLACNGAIDDFVGVILMKEFFIRLNKEASFRIQDIVVEPIIVPENMRAQKVLDIFKQHNRNIIVVVDEYGSLEGIITLHDLFENLVGSIPDDNDADSEPDIFFRDENSALVSGEAPIETLAQFIDDFVIDFDDIDYSTVAGFVLSHINKIPQLGDTFTFENITFEIVDIDTNKIDKILITKQKKEYPEDE